MNKSVNEKGQATLFIVIGLLIVIVTGIALYLVFYDSGEKLENAMRTSQNLPFEPGAVETFVETCLKDVSVPGIYLLANNGGYIYEYSNLLLAENKQISYHLDYGAYTAPSTEFMEKELSTFIKNSMLSCLDHFHAFEEYRLKTGEMTVESSISKESISIKMKYPIIITAEKAVIELSKFSEVFPVRLGRILSVRDDIIGMIQEDKGTDLDLLTQHDMRVTLLPYDSRSTVYSIYDNQSSIDNHPFVFNFAVKIESNNAPELAFLPDFVVRQGKLFVYDVNASDADEDTLTFFSNSSEINAQTGVLSIAPQETTTLRICARDGKAEDCKNMKLIVQNE